MGVTTTADERLDSAKEHLKQVIEDLNEILNPDTWGYDEFKKDYLLTLNNIRSSVFENLQKM